MNLTKIGANVRLGVVGGLLLALFYCVWALLIFLVRGNKAFAANDVTLPSVLLMYLTAGVAAGLVIGLGLTFASRHVLGAALVGFSAAFTGWFVVAWSVNPQPITQVVKTSAILGAAFGIPIGVGYWFQVKRYLRTGKWS